MSDSHLSCGSCSACCTLLAVHDIGKPRGMACWWTTIHGGCLRHGEKASDPLLQACATFKCVWLESQELDDPARRWAWELRPNNSHVMLGPRDVDDDLLLNVHVAPDHPNAWRNGAIGAHINQMIEAGVRVRIFVGEATPIEFGFEGQATADLTVNSDSVCLANL